MKPILYIVFLAVALSSCSKDEGDEENVGPEPEISYISLNPLEVENFNNSVILTITYKDNNGDLGFEDPDIYSLWVKDSRLDSADWYHVPPLAPPGYSIPIQGSLNIVLNSMFILGNGDQELASLSVKLVDRAGNWSNIITTPSIVIKKP